LGAPLSFVDIHLSDDWAARAALVGAIGKHGGFVGTCAAKLQPPRESIRPKGLAEISTLANWLAAPCVGSKRDCIEQ